ncbi:putative disease resistance RPP13-like protein 1 [Sesamum alatum]|uniref:Disease resistance RPP13-like protein 1 n=1 Tax=Sesamum alatum TaxID=300844 RepID=A0AAE1YKG3_9LAMI|nr:putative disease resistance RPP13-like protein 1 [Sesamum alatum]
MGDSSFASGFKTGFGSAFLQFALERFATFGSFAWREIGVIWGVEDELRKLQRTYLKIQELVEHMEGSSSRFFNGSKAWQIWFEDMRKLAYDADALLDHVALHLSSYCAERSVNAHQENQVFSMVLSSFNELKLPNKICKMQEKLEELAKEMEGLVMIEKFKQEPYKTAPPRSTQFNNFYSTVLFADDKTVVGRERDREYIVECLSGKCERADFSVIPIVGMGGIGKTTFARLIYDDERVCHIFGRRIWVSISMDFDMVRIAKSIVESATLCACNLSDLISLQAMLRDILSRRKFLLVLDDYWSESHADWDVLCSLFRFGSKGSKIIVTTRSTKVSLIVSCSRAYKLDNLSDDDCWKLIEQRTLSIMQTNQNLEPISRQIAKKCKGLPLVAVTLGCLLRCKSTEEEWHSILESELWDMPQTENVFPVLMLSYVQLPAHLRKCFSYCSIFPQNHEFEVEEVVLLWMAEGFIQPVGARRLEDLGADYFNDLYSRSFFQQYKNTWNKKTIYKMHDLIHDMARVVSKDICFHTEYNSSNCYPLFGNACHLSLLHDNNQQIELKASLKNERLRTFLLMSNNVSNRGELHPELFQHLQFLRVLGLSNIGIAELPDSIGKLEYLRYLNLSGNPISHLPESMCRLAALQTLKLTNCPQLRDLPKDMKKLANLRHLNFDVKGQLQSMPLQFGRLTSLQTLSAYIVGRKEGNGIRELKNMNGLRGSLCIKNIEHVSDLKDAVEAKLGMKTCLDRLELQWRKLRSGLDPQLLERRRNEQAQVFANLQPHENVKELIIENYCGIIYPDWLSQPWRKFTSIRLQGLKYCDNLPSLGQLPFLKYFAISDLPCLKYVDHNFYGTCNAVTFPLLESFQLDDMSGLIHWRNVSNDAMPCLNTFTIQDCPNLISLPPKLLSLLPNSSIRDCGSLQAIP